MPKTRITKKNGGIKVAEVKRNIIKALNPGKLKDRETCRLQKGTVAFSFSSTFKHLQPRWKSSDFIMFSTFIYAFKKFYFFF